MEEIWKEIAITNGRYLASNLGKIRHKNSDKPLKPKITKYGYCEVQVFINGRYKCQRVHRLVATTFHDNPLNKKEVNHINGIKTDNSASNLEWATNLENQRHAWRTGLKKPINYWVGKYGKDHGRSIPIIAIFPDGSTKEFASGASAEREIGLKKAAINAVCRGKRKSHKNIIFKYKLVA